MFGIIYVEIIWKNHKFKSFESVFLLLIKPKLEKADIDAIIL